MRLPYRVYVVELDGAACPGAAGRTCVYVGETADARGAFRGAQARLPRVPRRPQVGVRLRPDIYRLFPAARTREESPRLEAKVAARLRLQGYAVFGGH